MAGAEHFLSFLHVVASLVLVCNAEGNESSHGGCLAEFMTLADISRNQSVTYEAAFAARAVPFNKIFSPDFSFLLSHIGTTRPGGSHAYQFYLCVHGGKCLLSKQCNGRGTCGLELRPNSTALATPYTCRCQDAYTGYVCQTAVNPCKPSPCAHGGQCRRGGVDFVCTCKSGYSGKRCQDHWLSEEAFDRKLEAIETRQKASLYGQLSDLPASISQVMETFHVKFQTLFDVLRDGFNKLSDKVDRIETRTETIVTEPPRQMRCLRSREIRAFQHSGVFRGNVTGHHFTAYCDMKRDGGGWIVFQRRQDGSVDFNRVWSEYKKGFGSPAGEFWLGLETLHRLTSSGRYEFRVDLIDGGNRTYYAKYSSITVAGEAGKYRLDVGSFSGNVPIPIFKVFHNGQAFSTMDRDNDRHSSQNCARDAFGGGWFDNCYRININGKYGLEAWGGLGVYGLHGGLPYPLKFLELKIREI